MAELAKVQDAYVGRPSGDQEVVKLLEYWLEQAREGGIMHTSLAVVRRDDQVAYDYAGTKGLEDRAQVALKVMTQELEMLRQARLIGPRNMNLDASYVEFHLTGTPICWDFLIWLVDAEMTRRRLKGPPPLRVAFTREDQLDKVGRDFFENVFRPLLPLIGAVEDPDAVGGRHKPMYVPYDIVLACRGGEEVPRLKAPDTARETMAGWLHGIEPITITLREAPHWGHRNSNMEAWLKFAGDLERKGENVVFVRDTARATEALTGFATCPMAAWRIELRMALYEQAKCNLFVSNGPAGLALFGDRPYLYFNQASKNDKLYMANKPEWWMKSQGIKEGQDWPWALPTQRLMWKTDTYYNLCEAWEEHQAILKTVPPLVHKSPVAPPPKPIVVGALPQVLSSTTVKVLDKKFTIFGYQGEGWFNIFAKTEQYAGYGFDLERLRPIIQRNAVCLDIGANMGIMALAFAQLAPEGQISAFEASEATCAGLVKTVAASGFNNIKVFPWLVGRKHMRGKFVEDERCRSSSHFAPGAGDREMRSIDELKLARVDFIKIDVEGAELDVLEGAFETINRCKPVVMVELNTFALVHYRDLLPRQMLCRLLEIFPRVCYFDKQDKGKITQIKDSEEFLFIHMMKNGCVDDLLCSWG